MPKCFNCGQKTARTEDWACQWCGQPLMSGAYKKIPKTYRQLKVETLAPQEATLTEEVEDISPPDNVSITPAYTPLAESEPTPEPEPLIEPESEPESSEETEDEVILLPESKFEEVPELPEEPEPTADIEQATETEPPTAASEQELSVEELLLAYAEDGVAANAKFVEKRLRITGIVDKIEVKDYLDIYYITLNTAERSSLQTVRCIFDKQYMNELRELAQGQTVIVSGRFDGSIIDFRMSDCVLIR